MTLSPTPSVFTPARIEQLRRDAKRLGKSRGLSHAEALDAVAAEHGFRNWSLLARSTQPMTPAITSPRGVRAAAGLFPFRMDATRSELQTIRAIVDRYESVVGAEVTVDRLSLMMDLEACHCNACPLDLVSLHETARDYDLVHDVAGIARHLNRETAELEDFFRPRYAVQRREMS